MLRPLRRALPLLLVGSLPAWAAGHPRLELKLDDYQLQTRDFCFASGLRVSFQEDHSQPVVSVTSVIDRGSDADPPQQEGIAHLVEHLWFRSRQEGLPPTWDLLTEMGASINAFTANDITTYMTVAPRSMLPAVLQLEARRLMNAVEGVTEEVVTTERGIVTNELREGEAIDLGLAALYGKLYPEGHPYHRLTIGTREALDRIGLAEVQAFVDENYTPANTTILVVGDFSLDEAPQMLVEAFPPELVFDPARPEGPASAEQCPVRLTGPAEPPPDPADRTVAHLQAPVERPMAIMAWAVPGAWREDTPLMELVSWTLTWAVSTYINPQGTFSFDRNEAWCGLQPAEHASTVICAIDLRKDADPEKVIRKAADGLHQLWDPEMRQFQQQYYGLARLEVMASIFRSADEVATLFGSRATDAAMHTHFTGNSAYYSASFMNLGAVDGQKAALFANRYLTRDRYAAVVLEPFAEDDAGLAADEGGYTGHPREPAKDSVVDLAAVDADLLRQLTVEPDLSNLREFTLDNGLRVVIAPYGTVPLARTALVVRGGRLHEPLPGLDRFTRDHTISRSSAVEGEMDEAPLRIGGQWDERDQAAARILEVNGSSANLEDQLWLLRQRLDGLAVEATDRKGYVRELRRELQALRETPEYWEEELARRALFGDHPLGRTFDEAAIDTVATVPVEQATAWSRHLYQPANATLVVVGRADADEAEALVRRWFADWKPAPGAGAPPAALPAPPAPGPRRVMVLDKPQVSQTQVRLHCRLDAAPPETRDLLAAVLDEMAWVALRESSGVTYGAGAWAWERVPGVDTLVFGSTVQTDAAGLAATTFLDLVDRAGEGRLDPDVLKLMQLSAARRYVLDQQSTGQMMDRLLEPVVAGQGWDLLTGHGNRLATVGVADLPPLVGACQDHEVLTLVGPAAALQPQLAAAGLEAEVFDWEAERDRRWAEHDPQSWKAEQKRRAKATK